MQGDFGLGIVMLKLNVFDIAFNFYLNSLMRRVDKISFFMTKINLETIGVLY